MRSLQLPWLLFFALFATAATAAPDHWGPRGPQASTWTDLPTWSEAIAPALGITLSAAIVADDGDGEVGPGERVRYTGTVSNPGDAPTTGVVFEINLDPGLTIDGSTLQFVPIAVPDEYTTDVDTQLMVGQATGIRNNDFDLDDPLPIKPVTAVTGQATTEGGTVDIGIRGQFTYTPPSGFNGTDTFTYTLTDRDGASTTGTVSVQVGAPPLPGVWFVDDDAAPGGNGSQSAPFQDHTQLNGSGGTGDVDEAGHTIFFYEGTYDIDDSFHLEPGQKIIGQGVDLVVDGDVIVSGSPGQQPAITHDTGRKLILQDGVELAGFDVGTPATPVGGIGLDGSAGGITSLTVDAMSIHTDGGAAIHLVGGAMDIELDGITTVNAPSPALTLTGVTGSLSVAGMSTLSGGLGAVLQFAPGAHSATFAGGVDIDASAGSGITLGGTGATVSVGGTSSTVDATGGLAFNVPAGPTLSGTFASVSSTNSFGQGMFFNGSGHTVSVTGTTAITNPAAEGVLITNSTGSSFGFGATTVTGGTDGIHLLSNGTASFTFGDTDVSNTANDGIEIANSNGTHTFAAGSSITGASGSGLLVNNGTPTVGFDGSITNTVSRSLFVSNLTGGSVTVSGTIDDDGEGIASSSNSGATINLSGNLDLDTSTSTALSHSGGGTMNVTGASNAITTTTASAISCTASATLSGTFHDVDVTAGTSTGVNLSACPGSKAFVDVDVTTTGATGFHATSAGTLQVTGASGNQGLSTASTTNGRAVNIDNSTIGAGGVLFGSISSTGGDHGIRLNTVGGAGAFHVTGIGPSDPTIVVGVRGRKGTGNGSGGTLTGSTNDHVSLSNVNNVVLRHMVMSPGGAVGDDGIHATSVNGLVIDNTRIENTGTHGVRGVGLSNLTVLNSEVFGAGDADEEDGFNLSELLGTSSITSTRINNHITHGIEVFNDTKTSAASPDRLLVQNTEVTDSHPTFGEIGIKFETSAAPTAVSNFSLEVSDSFIARVENIAIQANSSGTNVGDRSRIHVDVRRTSVTGSGTDPNIQVPTAVAVLTANQAEGTFIIDDNNAANSAGFTLLPNAGILIRNNSDGTLQGVISDTEVDAGGSGINVTAEGLSASGTTTVDLRRNTASSTQGGQGMRIFARDNGSVRLNATVEGNTISNVFDFDFALWMNLQDAADSCFDVGGPGAEANTISATGSFSRAIQMETDDGSGGIIDLEGYAGAQDDETAIEAYLTANNTISVGSVNADRNPGGTIRSAVAPCPLPVVPAPLAYRLPDAATTFEAPIAEASQVAPLAPEALAAAPEARALALERPERATRYVIGEGASVGPVASGPDAGDSQPSVEVAEIASGANMVTQFAFTLNDFPAGMTTSFAFEATTGQNIKTDELSTTVTLSASNAADVTETATTDALPSREIRDLAGAGWRNLSVPVDGVTVDDLAQMNLVQCIPGYYESQGRCTAPTDVAVNLFTAYDGTALVPATNGAQVLQRGQGIYWYMFDAAFDPGAPGPSPSESLELPVTLSAAGPVPAGDVTVPLHNNGDRWNLLGNPFPQDLDISGIGGWTSGGSLTTPVGQIWNPAKKTFTLTSQKNDRLAAWQGAFFRNFDAASLTFMEAATIDDAQFLGKAPTASAPVRGLSFALDGTDARGQSTADGAIRLTFIDGAHTGADAADVDKLAPPVPTYAVAALEGDDGALLAQRSMPRDLDRAVELPLHVVANGAVGAQTLTWPTVEDIPETWTLRLVDRTTGTTVDLREAEAYTFTPEASGASTQTGKRSERAEASLSLRLPESVDALTGSGHSARFLLVVGPGEPEAAGADTPEAITLDGAYPNPFGASTAIRYTVPSEAHVRLVAFDVLGREVALLADEDVAAGTHTATWTPGPLAAGTYVVRLRARGADGALVERSLRVTHNR